MADEYITKEQAKVAFDDSLRLSAQEWNMIFEGIDNLPAADVAPVRHGRWIDQGWQDVVCSVCGNDAAAGYDEAPWLTPYCPFCGALMREVNNG